MNTANLKRYAPQARREFITAISKQLNQLGIYSDKQISDVKEEGSVLLIEGKAFTPDIRFAREKLVKKVKLVGYAQLVEQEAYTWFNRLCAIRYMEIHDYLGHGFRVLSHPDNPTGFEIIDHAVDAADELALDRDYIIELKLAGNKDETLYRRLLLKQCHKLHEAMPFLFEALNDATELLLPDNLTRTDSILRGLVDGIPEEDWDQVEVIGWLYQFYISEKKDEVMGKVVKSEDIPAATQLFTPNWIVKYLVQNSVGRQWLQTYPESATKAQMEYYIEPAEQSSEVNEQLQAMTPDSIDPESIKVLDPAVGSGHILIEAYNVLKAIYEERGFRSREIPQKILENNLYGLDIDDRAAQLSGFALMMLARADDKRIFTRHVSLNILALQEGNHINLPAVWRELNLSGGWDNGTSQDMFSDETQDLSSFEADNRYQLLQRTLARFSQAKTFGSLIEVPTDEYDDLKEMHETLVELAESGDSFQRPAAKQLIDIVHQALILSIRYDAVVANPPYMGGKGMNNELKKFAKEKYPNSKSDLFAMFMERAFALLTEHGFNAQVNMQSWMFLASYEQLRENLLDNHTFFSMAHLGSKAFSQINGEVVQTTAWIISNSSIEDYQSTFYRLIDGNELEKKKSLLERRNEISSIKTSNFKKIPGNPIAYWINNSVTKLFEDFESLSYGFYSDGPCKSGNDDKYLRYFWEVPITEIGIDSKWRMCSKGGEFKKYFGNIEHVLRWEKEDRLHYRSDRIARITSIESRDLEGITWSIIGSSSGQSFRYLPKESLFNSVSPTIFEKDISRNNVLAFLNSSVANHLLDLINPTLATNVGNVLALPLPKTELNVEVLLKIAKKDWDEYENSLDFSINPLVELKESYLKISMVYEKWRSVANDRIEEFKFQEEKNNKMLVNEFKLNEIVSHQVDLKDVTLKCNPEYVYDLDSYKDNMNRFQSDNICHFILFIIGCMLGRYSLDRKGLVYANSGNEGFDKLVAEGAYKSFSADEDGIIPLTDQEWFKDDATDRLREFVQVVWGSEHLQENLDFIAESLCLHAIKPLAKKGQSESALETIRRYLSTQFYKDHLKTYKKRPIYWLFSSGKNKAFECLVYLHRYNEGTLSRMRTEYVTPLLGKYDAYAEQLDKQIDNADSTSDANRFKKELAALVKQQVELREFDDKLKHYADMRISLDLDDGVKVNYGKFGDLLSDVKSITGSAPEVI